MGMQRLRKLYNDSGVHYILLLCILILYTFIGAWIFIAFEAEADKDYDQSLADHQQLFRYQLGQSINRYNKNTISDKRNLNRAFDLFEKKLKCAVATTQELPPWEWSHALFFAGSVYSTIGYGNKAPRTMGGRLFVIPYATLGIPLFVYILLLFGRLFHSGLSSLIVRCTSDKQRHQIPFVFLTSFLIFVLYTLVVAGLFLTWEPRWDYFTSYYFVFNSLTTLGLGDIVPANTKVLLFNFVLIVVGLFLLSTCYAAVQSRNSAMFTLMYRQIRAGEQSDRSDLSTRARLDLLARQQPFFNRVIYTVWMSRTRKAFLESIFGETAGGSQVMSTGGSSHVASSPREVTRPAEGKRVTIASPKHSTSEYVKCTSNDFTPSSSITIQSEGNSEGAPVPSYPEGLFSTNTSKVAAPKREGEGRKCTMQ